MVLLYFTLCHAANWSLVWHVFLGRVALIAKIYILYNLLKKPRTGTCMHTQIHESFSPQCSQVTLSAGIIGGWILLFFSLKGSVFALRFENLLARNSLMKIFKHEKEEKLAGPTGNLASLAPFLVVEGLGPALNVKTEGFNNNMPFSLTLCHFRWHWGVQNTNYDIEINAICSGSVRF